MQDAKAIVEAESSDGGDGLTSFLRAQPMSDESPVRLVEGPSFDMHVMVPHENPFKA